MNFKAYLNINFIFIFLFSILSSQAFAVEDEIEFNSNINQLSAKSLKDKGKVIDLLIESSNPNVEKVLQSLLEGKVFFVKKDKTIVLVKKNKNEFFAKDIITGKSLGIFSKRQIKKVTINNSIRKKIKSGLSILNLQNSDDSVRLNAVKNSYNNIDSNLYKKIQDLVRFEKNEKIRNAMFVLLDIYHLDSIDKHIKIQAIKNLSNNLEPVVKNKLFQIKNNEKNLEIKIEVEKALSAIETKTSFFKTLETIFFGISFGSVLILAAIGLAITFGVMGVINMAHGELIMLGAYTTYVVQMLMPNFIEASLFFAIPAAFLVSGLFGIIIQTGIIRHLHGRPLETLLATFGVSLVLQQLVRTVFSPLNRSVETPNWMSGALEINGILSLTWNRLYIIFFCLVVFTILMMILKKTALGLQVRAVSQDRNMAKVMGVRSNRVDAMTFGLGSGIAGIAGVALSQLTNVGPNLGQSYIIDSFMVVVFGGVGNLWGTLISGFGLGIINKFMEPWAGAVLAKVFILIFIVLFIQKKPKGLFPQKGRSAGD
tara:strand:- start:7782 stop:9401 length:1620 start_codon:yes stop_codon:yes gene_type:complete